MIWPSTLSQLQEKNARDQAANASLLSRNYQELPIEGSGGYLREYRATRGACNGSESEW